MKKICFVLTVESAVKAFLLNHLRALSAYYDITVIVNTENPNFLVEAGVNAKVIPLKIVREISIFPDLLCLLQLIKIFRQQPFSAVHSITPKAGFLAMIAAKLLAVPVRVHMFTGQVWETETGLKRYMLKNIDRLIGVLTTVNLSDGHAQLNYLLKQNVLDKMKSKVFLNGSIAGVDSNKFKFNIEANKTIRQRLNILEDDVVFLFIGRLNKDKGVLDLALAFRQLNGSNLHLLYVGPDEDDMQSKINALVGCHSIHFIDHTDKPEFFMSATDVLCLPSYREGFNNVTIEAAAIGVPSIVSNIYGITDAVIDGQTGLLHEVRDVIGIKICMSRLVNDKYLRLKLGEQAKQRVLNDFDSDAITQAWIDFYHEHVACQ